MHIHTAHAHTGTLEERTHARSVGGTAARALHRATSKFERVAELSVRMCFRLPAPAPAALAGTRRRHRPALLRAHTAPSLPSLQSAYAEDGWVCVRAVLDALTLETLHAATDELEAEAKAAALVCSERRGGAFFEVQSASGRKHEPAAQPGLLRKVTNPSKRHQAFADLRKSAELRHLAASLAGIHTVRCTNDQVNFKAPGLGTGFPWHQDASFLFGHARRSLEVNGGVNVVLALDESNECNGGFAVLSGTHRGGLIDLHGVYDTSATGSERFDTSRRRVEPMQPGDALFFHPLLAHGSGPNISARRRRIVTLWYVGEQDEPGVRGER